MRNSIDLLFSIAEVNIDFIKINIIDMFISVMLGLRDTRMYSDEDLGSCGDYSDS